MTSSRASDAVRAARAALVADLRLRGRDFGRALSEVIDDVVRSVLIDVGTDRIAVLAMGSYARRALCPGSDVDVLLLHDRRPDVSAVADALWYPLWDAGFVLGHATRTAKESIRLAEKNLESLTALLDARWVDGDLHDDADRLVHDARGVARRHGGSFIAQLSDAATVRRLRPGSVAEMLEPNLKDGAGGLRDLQALDWAEWAIGDDGDARSERGQVRRREDAAQLDEAGTTLLDVRVALHRVTGSRSDVLALQDQDAVAALLEYDDADTMVRAVATVARRASWIVEDAWARRRVAASGPRAPASTTSRSIAGGVIETDGRLELATDVPRDASLLLRVARAASESGCPIDRDALAVLSSVAEPSWSDHERDDFFAVLRGSSRSLDVFDALGHVDLMTRILPEWEHVRCLPQRNAYHRFTVDRHLLETVSEAAKLLNDPNHPEAYAARALELPRVLLMGALLHDIAKGRPGDHATVGAEIARDVGRRVGLTHEEVNALEWLVRDHLLMADTATRRDLADPVTITRFGDRVRTLERLRLLALLTVADSKATGPAAWGPGKAALVQELYRRTRSRWTGERAVRPTDRARALWSSDLDGPGVVVRWDELDAGRLQCTVGAPDRPGLLAAIAGALSIEGLDIAAAEAQTLSGGRAVDTFAGNDRFDRLTDATGRDRAAATVRDVLGGEISIVEALHERRIAYSVFGGDASSTPPLQVRVAQDESVDCTVVEVFARDQFGLLATVASVFSDLALDVKVARVATTGEQAVDIFYVQDAGEKVTNSARLAALHTALASALSGD